MTNPTNNAATEAAPKVNKITKAFEMFADMLPKKAELGDRMFRRTMLDSYEAEFNIKHGSAVGMYQKCKARAVEEGLCEEFGAAARVPGEAKAPKEKAPGKEKGIPADVMQELEDRIEEPEAWTIVDKATGVKVGTAVSRAKAQKAKTPEQKVVKTVDFVEPTES